MIIIKKYEPAFSGNLTVQKPMKLEDHIQYWLDSAAHDWDTAQNLFSAGNMIGAFLSATWFLRKL